MKPDSDGGNHVKTTYNIYVYIYYDISLLVYLLVSPLINRCKSENQILMVIGAASNSTKFGRCIEASKLHANDVKEVHARKASNLQNFMKKSTVSPQNAKICQDIPRYAKYLKAVAVVF